MRYYILYLFIFLSSSCAQKKFQEPIETKNQSAPAISDSFANIAKDAHKKLADFIHQNRSSSDPATKYDDSGRLEADSVKTVQDNIEDQQLKSQIKEGLSREEVARLKAQDLQKKDNADMVEGYKSLVGLLTKTTDSSGTPRTFTSFLAESPQLQVGDESSS